MCSNIIFFEESIDTRGRGAILKYNFQLFSVRASEPLFIRLIQAVEGVLSSHRTLINERSMGRLQELKKKISPKRKDKRKYSFIVEILVLEVYRNILTVWQMN